MSRSSVGRGIGLGVVAALVLTAGSVANADQTQKAPRFEEIPGKMEFSGKMIVRPLQAEAMAELGKREGVIQRVQRRAQTILSQHDIIEYFPEVDEYIVAVPEGLDENSFSAQLMSSGAFQYATPDWWITYADTIPNDPAYPQQWHLPQIQAPAAWDLTVGSEEIILSFIDSGVDTDHSDLEPLLLPGYNAIQRLREDEGGVVEDTLGHGTNVAGCISALSDNSFAIAAPNWITPMIPVKLANGGFNVSDVTHGARWAIDNGARTASCSVVWVEDPTVQTTGEYITSQGGILLWAAGNNNRNLSGFDWDDVVVCGATDRGDVKAGFSAYGRAVDVFAPGVGIVTSSRSGGWNSTSGTSFSTPMTNGVIGLIWSIQPNFTTEDVLDILYTTCDDLGAPGEDDFWGHGRINAFRAVEEAIARSGPSAPVARDDSFLVELPGAELLDIMSNDFDRDEGQVIELVEWDENTVEGGTVTLVEGGGAEGRDALLYTPPADFEGNDSFTYTITDNAEGNDSATVTLRVIDPDSFRRPENPIGANPGLIAEFYYNLDNPTQLPDFDELDRNLLLIESNINYPSTNGNFAGTSQSDNIGAVFTGWVTVGEADVYTFYTESDDGSRLWIGDQLVVDNDGLHGMVEVGGSIGLLPGTHEFRVEFFEATGGAGLIARWESSTTNKGVIPPAAFSFGGDVPNPVDWNGDGVVNAADVGAFLSDYFLDLANGTTVADYDGNGVTNASDVGAFLSDYFPAL